MEEMLADEVRNELLLRMASIILPGVSLVLYIIFWQWVSSSLAQLKDLPCPIPTSYLDSGVFSLAPTTHGCHWWELSASKQNSNCFPSVWDVEIAGKRHHGFVIRLPVKCEPIHDTAKLQWPFHILF